MNSRILALALAAALAVTGCGGGGGGGDSGGDSGGTAGGNDGGSTGSGGSSDSGGATGTTKTTPGVWQGTVTSMTTGTSSVMGLTTDSGHGVWMTTDGRVWAGQMPANGTQMNVDVTGYMYPGRQFPDGGNHGMWSMSANFANGSWSGRLDGNGDHATFDFSMHPAYDRPASLDLLAGTYTRTTSIGYTITLSFTRLGELTGSDSRGCVFNGSVSVPDPAHNLYQIAATVSSCGILDGAYQGHGTLVDATAMQRWVSDMGCFQYGAGGWGGGMMGGGMMRGGAGHWWPYQGSNTVPTGTGNLFMFAMTDGRHAIMDALAR